MKLVNDEPYCEQGNIVKTVMHLFNDHQVKQCIIIETIHINLQQTFFTNHIYIYKMNCPS